MIKPAIVAVGYNRPDGMKRLLESIGKASYNCDDVPLIVSIDESNRSDEVEAVAQAFEWKYGTKEIRRFPERQGLRKHIVHCGDYSEKYGAVIILEDDLVVAEDFYSYVCAAHEKYGDEKYVGKEKYINTCLIRYGEEHAGSRLRGTHISEERKQHLRDMSCIIKEKRYNTVTDKRSGNGRGRHRQARWLSFFREGRNTRR